MDISYQIKYRLVRAIKYGRVEYLFVRNINTNGRFD